MNSTRPCAASIAPVQPTHAASSSSRARRRPSASRATRAPDHRQPLRRRANSRTRSATTSPAQVGDRGAHLDLADVHAGDVAGVGAERQAARRPPARAASTAADLLRASRAARGRRPPRPRSAATARCAPPARSRAAARRRAARPARAAAFMRRSRRGVAARSRTSRSQAVFHKDSSKSLDKSSSTRATLFARSFRK